MQSTAWAVQSWVVVGVLVVGSLCGVSAKAAAPSATFGNPIAVYAYCVSRETRQAIASEGRRSVQDPEFVNFEARVLHRVLEACAPKLDGTAVASTFKDPAARKGYYAAVGDYTRYLVGLEVASPD